MWLAGILLAVAIGYVWVRAVLPSQGAPLDVSLGAALGIGLTSCLCFLLLICGLAGVVWIASTEIAVLTCGVVLCWKRRKARQPAAEGASPWNWALGLALAAGFALLLMSFADSARQNPQGEWDAWAIWNLRAKFLAGGAGTWRHAVSGLMIHTHPEYPLLVPAFIARCWTYAGGQATASAPIATALLFFMATGGILISALARLRSASAGLLAGMVLLAGESYLSQVSSQYADIPLSMFLLAALVMVAMSLRDETGGARWLVAAGVFASLGAWTKNEGILFVLFLVVSCLVLGWRRQGARGAGLILLGAAPVMALVAWFKIFLAPVADPLTRQTGAALLAKLADPGRYWQIGQAFVAQLIDLGRLHTHPLLLIVLLAVMLRTRNSKPEKTAAWICFTALGLMLAAYFGVFLITPADLTWHLNTALGRLYGQLWPAALFAAFLALPRVEDGAALPAGAAKKKQKKG